MLSLEDFVILILSCALSALCMKVVKGFLPVDKYGNPVTNPHSIDKDGNPSANALRVPELRLEGMPDAKREKFSILLFL